MKSLKKMSHNNNIQAFYQFLLYNKYNVNENIRLPRNISGYIGNIMMKDEPKYILVVYSTKCGKNNIVCVFSYHTKKFLNNFTIPLAKHFAFHGTTLITAAEYGHVIYKWHILNNNNNNNDNNNIMTYKHGHAVRCLNISNDGKLIICKFEDNDNYNHNIYLFCNETLEICKTAKILFDIDTLTITNDNKYVYCSTTGMIMITWDLETLEYTANFTYYKPLSFYTSIDNEIYVGILANNDVLIKYTDTSRGGGGRIIFDEDEKVERILAISNNCDFAVVCTAKCIKIYNMNTLKYKSHVLHRDSRQITSNVIFTKDDLCMLFGYADKTLGYWNTCTGKYETLLDLSSLVDINEICYINISY
jgi:WD40 repeat protein